MQIILGSQSPRRKEILSYFSLPFTQDSPAFNEEAVQFQDPPEKFVCQLAKGKADSLTQKYPDALLITADTIVYRNGKIYGKPKDDEEAFHALSELVGDWHTVYTGVTVQHGKRSVSQAEATQVLFNQLTATQIHRYIAHTDYQDKAGGYAIQMAGGLIVRKIDGCYYNVMGLPINTLEYLLRQFNVPLWDYL